MSPVIAVKNATANLLDWILKHNNYGIAFLLHYVDDFHTLGQATSSICQQNPDKCIHLFQEWGIPLHPDKLEGPFTCLTVLGIDLDLVTL